MTTFSEQGSELITRILTTRECEIVCGNRYLFSRRKRSRSWRLHQVCFLNPGQRFNGVLLHPPGGKGLEGPGLGFIPAYDSFPTMGRGLNSIEVARSKRELYQALTSLPGLLAALMLAAETFKANILVGALRRLIPGVDDDQRYKSLLMYKEQIVVDPALVEIQQRLASCHSLANQRGEWAMLLAGCGLVLKRSGSSGTTSWRIDQFVKCGGEQATSQSRLLLVRSPDGLIKGQTIGSLGLSLEPSTTPTFRVAPVPKRTVLMQQALRSELVQLATVLVEVCDELKYILAGHFTGIREIPERRVLTQTLQFTERLLAGFTKSGTEIECTY